MNQPSFDRVTQVLQRIKSEHITPRARWMFLAREALFWGALALTALIAVIGVSFAFLELFGVGRYVMDAAGVRGAGRALVFAMPLVWPLLACVAIIGALVASRFIRHGYRRQWLTAAGLITAAVLLVSTVAHVTHVNRFMDRGMRSVAPQMMRAVSSERDGRWSQPRQGVLAGRVESVASGSLQLRVRDMRWQVSTAGARIEGTLAADAGIVVFGAPMGSTSFTAQRIRVLPPSDDGLMPSLPPRPWMR